MQFLGLLRVHPGGVGKTRPIYLLTGLPGKAKVASIAGKQSPLPIPNDDGVGNAIDQGPLELEPIVQILLGTVPPTHLELQSPVPQQHQGQHQQTGQEHLVELRPVPLPNAVGGFRTGGPAADDASHVIGRDRQQCLVQDAQQFRVRVRYREGKMPWLAIQRRDDVQVPVVARNQEMG
ncbi:hypothetical protein FQZ97_955290 [compost metagenome]